MAQPVLVIVGRPNVGKSTLFNRIIMEGKKGTMPPSAIVEDIPGVTRDRNCMTGQWQGRAFIVVDTGGFYADKDPDIQSQVREQALFAIDEADLIIHLLDGKEGINPSDMEILDILRLSGRKFLFAVNKIDGPTKEDRLYDFYRLGGDEPIAMSAKTGYNFENLMDKVISVLPAYEEETLEYPNVAIVGRPNVGKSTMVNSLLGKKRMIVSPMPGTTRDPIDSIATYYGRKYLLIDTAGMARKAKAYSIEKFAMMRAEKSIERSDVSLIVLDALEGIVSDDQKIAGMVCRHAKGTILLLNKWDLIHDPDEAYKRLLSQISRKLWFLSHAPILTTSGAERKRLTKVFLLIDEVMEERKKRISTRQLNTLLRSASDPAHKGKKFRLDYISQIGIEPPAFCVFAKHPDALKDTRMRYLEGLLRERFSFRGTPIKIFKRLKEN